MPELKNILLTAVCSACLAVLFSGCNVASVDRNAVQLALDFSEPESFPFMKLDRFEKEENGCIRTVPMEPDMSDAEINALLKQGYRKKYSPLARIFLYTFNTATGQWEPITQYSVNYSLDTGAPWPVKEESYHPGKACLGDNARYGDPYTSETVGQLILDFSKRPTIFMKVVVIPVSGSAEARYCIIDIKRGEMKKWSEETKLFGPFDWSVSMPEAKVVLPSWNKWQSELHPPTAAAK